MKALSILIGLLSIAVLTSCGTAPPVADPNPPTIDMGHKRVETSICGRWSVGENGCIFPEGRISGVLKIYRIWEGELTITGQGCGVDKSITYPNSGGEWIDIDLRDLVGSSIEEDCFLNIIQFPKFKGQDQTQFPVRGINGSVLLGVCPAGVKCSYSSEQRRAGSSTPTWSPNVPASGQYLLRGCGKEIVPATQYAEPLKLDLKAKWPGGYPTEGKVGCTFILAVRGDDGQKLKTYRRIWFYKKGAILLPAPAIEEDKFTADSTVSLSIADGVGVTKNSGSFKPKAEGNMLRFYTVQGRSLVVKVKGGKVEWTQ